MKIKEVCTQTGLTERAVRFYIEKGLLQTNSQIINGRVTREFTEREVDILKDISKLRKAGFSIQDILDMQNPENNINDIIFQHYSRLEGEQIFRNDIIQELKEINKRGNMSWRKLSSILFNNRNSNNLNNICFPLPESELTKETNKEKLIRFFKRTFSIITATVLLSLMIIIPTIKGIQNQKLLTAGFMLTDVIIEEKWCNGEQAYARIKTSGVYSGYEDYFVVPQAIRLKSLDQYQAIQVESKPYMSLNIWLEMPCGVANRYHLLDSDKNIKIGEVLKSPSLIKEYCTVVSIHQYE